MTDNREKRVVRFRRALESIRDYSGRYEDYSDMVAGMRLIAKQVLREADEENNSK